LTEKTASRITDTIYTQLREEIIGGLLPPGSRLSVPALAERLNVSRSPVRDAVVRLVQDRLATEEPRRGAVVALVGGRELAALYEVREVLEGLAARLAIECAGRRLVDALRETIASHARAVADGDMARHLECDMRFHALIREAAGNPALKRMLEEIQTQVRLAMQTTIVTGGPKRALDDHRAILAAFEKSDAVAAAQAARAHIARLREALLARVDAETAVQ
jgi:DNA-binding GntR family transcriptional regulator